MRKFKITFSKWEDINNYKHTIVSEIDEMRALCRFFKTHNINTTYIVDVQLLG